MAINIDKSAGCKADTYLYWLKKIPVIYSFKKQTLNYKGTCWYSGLGFFFIS